MLGCLSAHLIIFPVIAFDLIVFYAENDLIVFIEGVFQTQSAYSVSVKAVNTMKQGGGKRKMKYTNQGVSFQRTRLFKKAIVTLSEGNTIDSSLEIK